MKTLTVCRLIFPFVFALLFGCNAADSETTALTNTPACTLTAGDSFIADEPVLIGLEIDNPGNETVEVLRYFTPIEGIMGPIYQVSFQGQVLDYLGPMVKRMPPSDEDWLALPAGSSLSADVEINLSWDLSRAGEYRIELSNDISYRASPEAETALLQAGSCGSVQFVVTQ